MIAHAQEPARMPSLLTAQAFPSLACRYRRQSERHQAEGLEYRGTRA